MHQASVLKHELQTTVVGTYNGGHCAHWDALSRCQLTVTLDGLVLHHEVPRGLFRKTEQQLVFSVPLGQLVWFGWKPLGSWRHPEFRAEGYDVHEIEFHTLDHEGLELHWSITAREEVSPHRRRKQTQSVRSVINNLKACTHEYARANGA